MPPPFLNGYARPKTGTVGDLPLLQVCYNDSLNVTQLKYIWNLYRRTFKKS